MIRYLDSAHDIFAVAATAAQGLVIPVNCEGIAGAGLALAARKLYPENFAAYRRICEDNRVLPGFVIPFDRGEGVSPRWLFNFATKLRWREASALHAWRPGLQRLHSASHIFEIETLAIPALGCGLGGLPWFDVRAALAAEFAPCSALCALVFEPKGGVQ